MKIVIPPKLQEEWTALYWQNIEEAEAERRYLSRFMDGRLYINAPAGYLSERFDNPYRREDLARLWAYSPIDRQTRRQRLYWLQSQTWETGVYHGVRVLIFLKLKDNGAIVRLKLYRLDSKNFPGLNGGSETLDLDAEGRQVVTVDPLPGALEIGPAEFWRGFDYQHEHGGRTPAEVEAAKHRREQIRKEYQMKHQQQTQSKGNINAKH